VEADEKVVLLSEKIAALVAEAEQAGTQVTISPRVAKFFLIQQTKNGDKSTKWPYNIQSGRKTDQLAII
jgi:hypothetical protein